MNNKFLNDFQRRKRVIVSAYDAIREIFEGEFYIAGGCFTKLDQEVNDFDVFFRSKEGFDKIQRFNNITNGIKTKETQNATAYFYKTRLYDFVGMRFFNSMKEVADFFDFTCCQGVYDGKEFYFSKDYMEHNFRKRIVINHIHHPVHTLKRVIKYSKNNYWICNGGIQHLIEAIRKESEERIRSKPLSEYPVD